MVEGAFDYNQSGLIFEQTSSAGSHFELAAIFSVMAASFESSQNAINEAEAAMAAHQAAVDSYRQVLDEPDYSPFITLPSGTVVRDLASGERLFLLPDGAILKTTLEGCYLFVGANGTPELIKEKNGGVTVSDGRTFELDIAHRNPRVLDWIEGLPALITPVLVADSRWSITFDDDLRLEISLADRRVTVINVEGTMVVVAKSILGIGERVDVRILEDGSQAFASVESKHGGLREKSSTTYLNLSNGVDLVIHFPNNQNNDLEDHKYVPCGAPV